MIFEFPISNKEILLHCIPQRDPFVMVDALLSYTDTEVVAGLTTCTSGLFVKENKLQESGLIEHMAQTVALHTGFGYFIKKQEAPTGYIGSITNLSIHRLPLIDEKVQTKAVILHEFSGVTLVNIESTINGEIIAEGQMKTVIAK